MLCYTVRSSTCQDLEWTAKLHDVQDARHQQYSQAWGYCGKPILTIDTPLLTSILVEGIARHRISDRGWVAVDPVVVFHVMTVSPLVVFDLVLLQKVWVTTKSQNGKDYNGY